MIDRLISFSIQNKLVIGMFVLALVGWGAYSIKQIPIDAVPDITTNQVQIITKSPTLAAQEVEQFVTFPIEIAMANLPEVVEIRSVSRFGISVITVVFEDDFDTYLARQLISEQLKTAESEIPAGFGSPELGPISTGLGEVYQYVLHKAEGFDSVYTDMDLRTINDWIIKRQLAGTPGVIEVSGWGGHAKQYEVAVNPDRLNSMHVRIAEVFDALESNNENTGGSYIEKRYNTYFIRGEGLVKSLEDIEKIVVKTENGMPILIRDIAKVGYGSAPRYGAITYNAQGEVVGGQVLMLKGENSYEVVAAIKERIESIKKSLPEGIVIEPYIDRSDLIGRAISTVTTNLLEGGLIVILILVLLLGNFRGGLIVASVIPLAMLFAVSMMNLFGVSANLMSLGAIDFGLVVDGSVIIVEAILHRLSTKFGGKTLTLEQMNKEVNTASSRIRSSAAFGEIIILIVYLPILALVGIEGKMFKPMAQTVSFAILGALILSMTYVPMMSALFLQKKISVKRTVSDRIIGRLQMMYEPVLEIALKRRAVVVISALLLFTMSLFTFSRMGGEFIPTLEEGDFALHQILPPGSSLEQSVEVSEKIQRTLLDNFPEIITVVSKIGTAEIATDPMPIEVGDIMVRMKPKEEWVTAKSKEEMFEKMAVVLAEIPGVEYEFTQPIQMRFNELIAGVREDIAIKIFGENPDVLHQKAKEVEQIVRSIDGVGDLRVEQTLGLPQMIVNYNRGKIAQYGLNIRDLNRTLRAAFAGEVAGVVFEEERRFELVVRLESSQRQDLNDIRNLFVPLPNGQQIPLKEVASIDMMDGPMQISREGAKRRIVVGVNARNRDTESLVNEIQEALTEKLELPAGYYLDYGGQFENLVEAKKRLSIAVPVALLLILVLLYFTFGSIGQAFLIFSAIPLSAIGGVYALWLRDLPFSISAGVGFIALFGVAVLNGIVLIAYFNQLKKEGVTDVDERIKTGTKVRLRPVILTASVAALGFLPMAISSSAGAEVQRPLATVVIGGLITATLLTLLVLPVLYRMLEGFNLRWSKANKVASIALILFGFPAFQMQAQDYISESLTLDQALKMALEKHPAVRAAQIGVEQQKKLKKSAFELDKTRISYSNGQLNSSLLDYQWQVSQGFKFPTTYITQSKLQGEKVSLSENALAVANLQIEHQIRSAWEQLEYGITLQKLFEEFVEKHKNWANVAQKRYAAGEINILEKTVAESEYQQILLESRKAASDAQIFQAQLAQWIGSSDETNFANQELTKIEAMAINSSGVSNNPELSFSKQQISVMKKEHSLQKAGFLPDLSIGYINQQIEGLGGLDAVQFGVGIPLFFWAQQGKMQAAKLGNEKAEAKYDNQLLAISTEFFTKTKELQQLQMQLDWYDERGLKSAGELMRFAERAYQAGEIDYVEYIHSLKQAINLKRDHLNILKQYNQCALDLQYLSGSFQ
jgi:heavy metal efflux system protein